ncbi:hypothetical protein GYB71_30970 [Sinorhizobium medicae]|nr:hypothetical protein [Sinorhizobium medicae]
MIRLDIAADAHHDITEDDFDRRACHRLNARELDLLLAVSVRGATNPDDSALRRHP